MNVDVIRQHWGLIVALLLLIVVSMIAAKAIYRRSARGQLLRAASTLRKARQEHEKTGKAVSSAEQRYEKLRKHAEKIKPRVLEEASEAVQDAKMLSKISNDKLMVQANLLRSIIYREFPPTRHETLRRKYLPDDKPDTRPFTF